MTQPITLLTEARSSREHIEANYTRYAFRPEIDQRLHFFLAISKAWKLIRLEAREPTNAQPVQEIGLARRVSQPIAEIGVYAAALAREVHPSDWQSIWLQANGYQVVTGRTLPSRYGSVGDVLALRDVEGVKYIYRSFATKDGDRLFLLLARCALRDYSVVEEEFLVAVQSFNLVHPTGQRFAEAMREYAIQLPSKGEFLFPASWEYRPDSIAIPGGVSFSALNRKEDDVVGHFTFAAVPYGLELSHQGLADNYLSQLAQNHVEVAARPLHDTQAPGIKAGVMKADKGGQPLQVRCAVAKHEAGWLLFGLVGPSADRSPEIEAVNRRAWEMALESFQLRT